MIDKILRGLVPVAAIALAAGLAGCKDMNINIGGEGVPLAELDMSGDPPTGLVLAGPDSVVVTDGDTLAIDVEGDQDAIDVLRFSLEDGTLGVMRENDSDAEGKATVRVTMPAPSSIVLAGSGGIAAQSMASEAEATIAGSGRIDVGNLAADKLDINVLGSGTFGAGGTAKAFDLTVAGAGDVEAKSLTVETADVSIAGSGNVTVIGRASCTVNSMGSGSLNCRSADDGDTDS